MAKYNEDAIKDLANAVVWVADKMFEDGYDAYPSTLIERLINLIGRPAYVALTDEIKEREKN